jgi:hypothetical protein
MHIADIVNQLREHRDRLDAAIRALESTSAAASKRRGRKPGRHMSADARRRIGIAMKKRWAERKKKTA